MRSRVTPWAILAAVLMIGFLVWLGAQMSRSGRSDEVLLILVACFALAGIAFGAGMFRRGSGSRD